MLLGQGFLDLWHGDDDGLRLIDPAGIFTPWRRTTNPAHIVVTTPGSLGPDVRTAWAASPSGYRPRATWVMSPDVEAKVRAFGNGLALSDFTVNLLADGTPDLTGRPVVTSDYAPASPARPDRPNYAVVGDFSRYVFVQGRDVRRAREPPPRHGDGPAHRTARLVRVHAPRPRRDRQQRLQIALQILEQQLALRQITRREVQESLDARTVPARDPRNLKGRRHERHR